ncbi:MAG: ABC transporter ATP-binding protein [Flavobacteriales bacterium]
MLPVIRNLQVWKKDRALTPALTLDPEPGRVYCLVSESGAGKSLLMQAMAGILPPGLHASGSVLPAPVPGKNTVYVFQDASAALNPVLRVDKLLHETWDLHHAGKSKEERDQRIRRDLEELQLDPSVLKKQFFELSGGQKQRIHVLLGLLCEADLLLLDEVTSALDPVNARLLLNIITRHSSEKKRTVLLAGHDIQLLRDFDISFIYLSDIEKNNASFFDNTKKNDLISKGTVDYPLISAKNIHFSYSSWEPVLRNLDLDIHPGEYIRVTGESGSGKSTLAALLSAQLKVTRGTILYPDLDPLFTREQMPAFLQLIFQDGFSTLPPFMPVWRILTEGAYYLGKVKTAQRKVLAAAWLQKMGLPADALNRRAHELSGGQRQRIGVARALACEPRVLLCDEITANLDRETARSVLRVIYEQSRANGMAVVYFTHQPDIFPFSFDACYHLGEAGLQRVGL